MRGPPREVGLVDHERGRGATVTSHHSERLSGHPGERTERRVVVSGRGEVAECGRDLAAARRSTPAVRKQAFHRAVARSTGARSVAATARSRHQRPPSARLRPQ